MSKDRDFHAGEGDDPNVSKLYRVLAWAKADPRIEKTRNWIRLKELLQGVLGASEQEPSHHSWSQVGGSIVGG